VRKWADAPPAWLEMLPVAASDDRTLHSLDDGQKAALTLATTLGADLILIDDRKAAAWHCRKDSRSPERWAFSLARLSVAYLTLPVRSIGLSSRIFTAVRNYSMTF